MRALPVLACLMLVSACGGEPDFDTRYDEQANRIDAMARNMQEELAGQLNAAGLADPAP
ncbi:MAG TPA: hypothetical protein VNS79_00310 [Sphingobium sp.]|nr:hypothetical protein [Sphingobium sp.]